MICVDIKPLSVNQAWKGRRYKTPKYKAFEQELMYILPKSIQTYKTMGINLEVGYTNRLSDWDNFIKPFIDVLQKKYGFDDKNIYEAHVKKSIVKKPYIKFKIYEYEETKTKAA